MEDEALVALDIRRGLQQLGYDVVGTASTSEEALRVAEASRPDLALMDIHIKGATDGIETARRLRQEWDVPAVYLTAFADDETLRRARETEPYGFLTKPFRERELRATLEMALYKVEMERRLRASEARLVATLHSIGDAVLVTDAQSQVSFLNPRAQALTGYSKEEALGRPLADVASLQVLALAHGGSQDSQNNGCASTASTCGACGDERGPLATLLDALAGGADGATAQALLPLRGGRTIPVECHATPLHEAGQATGVVLVLRDITERIEAERQRQRFAAELERSNRELQEFAFVASHDLQEPLRKIKAFGDRLRAKHGAQLGEGGLDYLDRMQSASGRMGALIDGLLSFSRVTTKAQPFALVDLDAVAREVLDDLEARLESSGGRVEVGALPTVEADALQMRQLLQNLISNALKFNRPDVAPVVQVSARALEGLGAEACEITVRDNGIGFEAGRADEMERVFAPFGRLHGRDEYEGTGMGLAICKRLAEHHGGSISAQSAPGQGAAFVVTLPLRRAAALDGGAR